MSRSKKYWLWAFAGIAVLITVGAWILEPSTKELSLSELQVQLERATPVGSTRSHVNQYLDSLSLLHSADKNPITVVILAKQGSPGSQLIEKSFIVHFFFDKADRLTRYSVEEAFTGP